MTFLFYFCLLLLLTLVSCSCHLYCVWRENYGLERVNFTGPDTWKYCHANRLPIFLQHQTTQGIDASTRHIQNSLQVLLALHYCFSVNPSSRAPHDAQNARRSRTRTPFHSLESCFLRGLHPLKLQPGGGFTL